MLMSGSGEMIETAELWRKRWQEAANRKINSGNQYHACYVSEIGTGRRGVLKTLKEPERSERRSRLVREIEILDQLGIRLTFRDCSIIS